MSLRARGLFVDQRGLRAARVAAALARAEGLRALAKRPFVLRMLEAKIVGGQELRAALLVAAADIEWLAGGVREALEMERNHDL